LYCTHQNRYLDAKIRTWIGHLKLTLPKHRAAEMALLLSTPTASETIEELSGPPSRGFGSVESDKRIITGPPMGKRRH
jgi:hypothetical protein